MEEKIYCPTDSEWDCPYFDDGECTMMKEEGCHPKYECDDYVFYTEHGEDSKWIG